QPAYRQRLAAVGTDLDRYLVGGAADATRAHLDRRADIAERVVEDTDRVLAAAPLDAVEGAVDDVLGDRFLALEHQAVHEFRHDDVAEFRVRQDFSLLGGTAARHRFPP